MDLIWFLAGLAMLLAGGDLLVRGAVELADRLGIPPVLVGMTVVAFGTSAPELVVTLSAAFQGTASIAFGNVVGSNAANLGLLLGGVALVRPLTVHPSIVSREIPMLILVSVVALVLASDSLLSGDPVNRLSRGDGLVLLLLFGVFLYYTLGEVLRNRSTDPFLSEATTVTQARGHRPAWAAGVLVLAGLGLLAGGGHLAVVGAVGVARTLQVPEVLIGLTMVAIGTSLPELVTSLMAARRGQTDLAVGNLVGSNLFNLLFVLGVSTTVSPAAIPDHGLGDLLVTTVLAALLLPLAITHERRVTRAEGAFLVLAYLAYLAWLLAR